MRPKPSSTSYRLSSIVYGLGFFIFLSFYLFLFSSSALAADCNVGQCFSTKNNPSCPAGWIPVAGTCTTIYGPGFCCDENKDPSQGPLVDTTGGSQSGQATGICFKCVNKSVFDQQCTKLGGKLDSANNNMCNANEMCCDLQNPAAVSQGGGGAPAPGGLTNLPCEATGNCEIKDLVAKAVMFAQFLMGLAGALFLFAFVYGGAMYILAFGRSSYTTKGKKAMVQAAIGMALIMGAWTIVTYLVSSLGAKI